MQHCSSAITVRLADHKRGWGNFCNKSCKAKYQEKRNGQYAAYMNGHGIENYHPDDPSTTNRDLLKNEMTDLKAVLFEVEEYIVGDIDHRRIDETWKKKLKYTYHQGAPK